MNAMVPICLLAALVAETPREVLNSGPGEVLFRCDFESDSWFKEWGAARAPERAELVASDEGLKFAPLDGKALRVRIDKGGHYGLSLACEKTDIRFRTVDTLRVENVWINFYLGGTWTSQAEHHLYIDDVVISKGPIGPVRSAGK